MAKPKTISSVLKELSAAYPKFLSDDDARDDAIRVWTIYLADIPDDLLIASVRKFISSALHAFAPSIPEIRKIATELRMEVHGIPSAMEAWSEVLRAPIPRDPRFPLWRDGQIVKEEPYQWSHEIVERVASALGWPHSFPDTENEMADRAHFFKVYEAQITRISNHETRLPMIDDYVENEKKLISDDRRTALETGERMNIQSQMRALAKKME